MWFLRCAAIAALGFASLIPVTAAAAEAVGEAVEIKTAVTGEQGPLEVNSAVYRDDRIRTYAVVAFTEAEAEQSVIDSGNLTVCASNDWEDYDDEEPDGEWEVGAEHAPIGNLGRPE